MPMTAIEGDSTCSCGGGGARHSAQEAALRFRTVFEHLKDGFFTVDRDWRFTYLNAAALRAFNGTDLTGQVIWEAFPDARATIFESEFHRVVGEGVTTEFEAYFPARKVWLRVAAFPFDLGLAVTIADVTELHDAREQLSHLRAHVDGHGKYLDDYRSFAHAVTHDLRAPLAAILGFSEALTEAAASELGPRSAHFLDRIRRAAGVMDQATQAILTLCRVGTADLKLQLANLAPVAAECVQSLRDAGELHTAHVCIDPSMWAVCDSAMMRVVLTNLLSNSWKYRSPDRACTIAIGVEFAEDEQMRFFVRDNGLGFDMGEVSAVSDAFHRLRCGSHSGEGIGLATVRRVIERHFGEVWAVSHPWTGTTVYFTLAAQG